MGQIDGVHITPIKVIPDERGRLMEIFRNDDDLFDKFGQVYMTTANFGVVKAWHLHKIQTDNMAVVKGMLKLVLFDGRDESPTKGELMEIFMGMKTSPLKVCIDRDEGMSLMISRAGFPLVVEF